MTTSPASARELLARLVEEYQGHAAAARHQYALSGNCDPWESGKARAYEHAAAIAAGWTPPAAAGDGVGATIPGAGDKS